MTSVVVTATPGTGALVTIVAGLGRGVRAGLVAALGCTLRVLPHLALALSGAAAVLAGSPVAFGTIKWLGVAYLIYLAWGTYRQAGVIGPEASADVPGQALSTRRVIGSEVLVNLLNPKLTLFFVFPPMFVDVAARARSF